MLNHGLANILTNGYGFIEDGKANLDIFSVKFLYSFLILETLQLELKVKTCIHQLK